MGYFPNGSAGMDYAAEYCARCVHEKHCTVWLAHLLRNYEECNKKNSILHILIPKTKDGLGNEACTMFYAKELAEGEPACQRCGSTERVAVHKTYCTAK